MSGFGRAQAAYDAAEPPDPWLCPVCRDTHDEDQPCEES